MCASRSEAKFHGLMKELALLEANLLKAEKMKQRCLLDIEHLEHVRAEIGGRPLRPFVC